MDQNLKMKVNEIIREINAVSRELEDISQGLTNEFKGIGANSCASNLLKASNHYQRVSNELRKL
ncbi:hypothetical protein [Pseudomonas sp. 2822-17]|uniref:hypothetical protein n=1 Tax=Pseudomonas sp. 2822-17 TaxID=1712678 RepID=UPI000C1457A3|nr:hypothetical protein [Pseudomonas sp. 2822-17]PIB65663.1 hypothetical protein AOA60_02980 [Pseudomonas sp. 2822-17]